MKQITVTVRNRAGLTIATTWFNGPEHDVREEATRRAFFAGVFRHGGALVSIA